MRETNLYSEYQKDRAYRPPPPNFYAYCSKCGILYKSKTRCPKHGIKLELI